MIVEIAFTHALQTAVASPIPAGMPIRREARSLHPVQPSPRSAQARPRRRRAAPLLRGHGRGDAVANDVGGRAAHIEKVVETERGLKALGWSRRASLGVLGCRARRPPECEARPSKGVRKPAGTRSPARESPTQGSVASLACRHPRRRRASSGTEQREGRQARSRCFALSRIQRHARAAHPAPSRLRPSRLLMDCQ